MQTDEIQENFSLATVFCDKKIRHLKENQKLKDNDARLIFFRKISQINDMTKLSYDLYKQYLLTHKWWKDSFPNHIISNKNKQNLCNSYDQHIRTSFILDNFSAFESSIRIIAQSHNSKKYEKLQYIFDKLVNWFMNEMGLSEQYPIIQVFTNIRNSMHSNGLFNPFNQENETIPYQNKIFSFKVGNPIEYGSWSDLFSITKIAVVTFDRIVENSKIKDIEYVKEPYSDFW